VVSDKMADFLPIPVARKLLYLSVGPASQVIECLNGRAESTELRLSYLRQKFGLK